MTSSHEFDPGHSHRQIFLIGMPGAGKTHWGRAVAIEYHLQFADLDGYISEQEAASIPALFAQYGEAGFREKEQKSLKEIITGMKATIIASGGGTPCFHDNMTIMKNAGTVIYLQAEVDALLHNLALSEEVRPLVKGKADTGGYLKSMLADRRHIYEQADIILPVKEISLTTFGQIISSCINRH